MVSVSNLNKLLAKTSGVGEPLLVLHGWGMNSSVWEFVRLHLESAYRVTWVDLPGHGFNHKVEATSMDQIVDLVCELIPNRTHIMGWSLGGLIAQAIAQQLPDKIKGMTLVASTPKFSQADNWPNAMSLEVLNNFSQSLKADIEGTLKRFIALQFMGVKDAKEIQHDLMQKLISPRKPSKRWGGVLSFDCAQDKLGSGAIFSDNIITPTIEALDLGLKILIESDFRNKGIELPQHWFFADRDRLIPKEVINDLKSLRPNAQITLLENAGHAPFMTHPEEFIKSVMSFINAR